MGHFSKVLYLLTIHTQHHRGKDNPRSRITMITKQHSHTSNIVTSNAYFIFNLLSLY